MKNLLLFAAMHAVALASFAQLSVRQLRTENRINPLGLDSRQPRLSWQLEAPDRNVQQSAYEIRVMGGPVKGDRVKDGASTDAGDRGKGGDGTAAGDARPRGNQALLWNSGKVVSGQSVHIVYSGPALRSGKRYSWQVRVWDNKGRVSAWSAAAFWQSGLFEAGDWSAKWIQPGYVEDSIERPSPLLRKEFVSGKKLVSATAYITAHGLYEAQLNGQRIGDAYLTPGWTVYPKRLQYQVYDVTALVHSGKNAVGVILGSGWYRGYLAFAHQHNTYGKDISLLFQLVLSYSDGSTAVIGSDESWKSSTGMIRSSEIYNGETIDARAEKPGWALPGYDDKDWSVVKTADFPADNLLATYNEPIRKHETFKVINVITTPKGEKVLDFGQNLVGWVQFKARGKAGDRIELSHAEVLDKAGNFYTDNLRAAKAQDLFILKGEGEESFEPHFTFHGFRYLKVEGYPGTLNPEDFTAITLYSDMPKTGEFSCSNPLINQLQHNIQWGQKGNFLDVPTDCPQRDERLGWTGDAQVFSRTAAYNMGVENFFTKWLKDVAADQLPSGSVPFVIPNVLGAGAAGSAGWADVATIIPWNLYLAYGDKRVLEQQYASMKGWVDFMMEKSKNDLWSTGFHFGDWLFYRPDDDNDGRAAVTDKYLIAQCFYAYSTQLLVNAAGVLGKTADVNTYTAQLKRIKDAYVREYMTANGRLVSGTQTAYVLSLQFDMLPEALREQAARRLAENVKSYNYHLTTGFLGTPYLCHVLSRFGFTDIAYRLLLQDSYPSWLYPVKMGATTIWERWDGLKPDGTFETPGMNSFNHYSYGAIGDWMYRVAAGIDTYEDGPGYQHSKIAPNPGGGLTTVAADLQTSYGLLSSHWQKSGDTLVLDIVIPPNTSSTVNIPAPEGGLITEGGRPLGEVKEIDVTGVGKGFLTLRLGSGHYHFSVKE